VRPRRCASASRATATSGRPRGTRSSSYPQRQWGPSRLPGSTGHVNRSGRYFVSSGSDDFVSTAAVSRVRPIRVGA
jgi:hypothetical protein